MKKVNSVLMVLLSAAILAGCNSAMSMKQLAEDEADAAKVRERSSTDRTKKEQERMEASLTKIPEWALEAPKPDASGIYATGAGDADSVNVARKKSMLDAEFGLAKTFKQEISGSERTYVRNDAGHTTNNQYVELVDKLVAQVPVTGFVIVKQEVKVIDGKYHSFVLLKLPYEQIDSVIKQQESSSTDQKIEKQFQDLERRIENRRKQLKDDATGKAETPKIVESTAEANMGVITNPSIQVQSAAQ